MRTSHAPADCLRSAVGQAIVNNSSTRVLLALDGAALMLYLIRSRRGEVYRQR
jgi:hypothetical protein